MSTIKSSTEHLTLNADGASKDIKFQANGVEVSSISSAGVMTATSFAGDGSALTNLPSDTDWDTRWIFGLGSNFTTTSNSVISWDSRELGADNTYSSGEVTIGTAGIYLITLILAGNTAGQNTSAWLQKNGSAFTKGRLKHSTLDAYRTHEKTWVVSLAATDVIRVWTNEATSLYGNSNAEHQQCNFTGIKIGAV